MPSTATVPKGFTKTVKGNDPGFVNALLRNFHLKASSPCRNIGANTLTYRDGQGKSASGVPTLEYVRHMTSASRHSDGSLDAGAYEFGTILPK